MSELGQRSLWRWLLWTVGVTLSILGLAYLSLIASSDALTPEEHQIVMDAVAVLEKTEFAKQGRALRRFASFRRTDNWWNQYVGHASAYAATNFPFGVVTLYPTFFKSPVDDVERASILLHESHHLFGEHEEEVLMRVWLEKERLGWTAERYGHTRVWKNTREWTMEVAPHLFTCGADRESDCLD